jgi:hypothetical protein
MSNFRLLKTWMVYRCRKVSLGTTVFRMQARALALVRQCQTRKRTEPAEKKEHERGARAYIKTSSSAEAEDKTRAQPQIILPVV